MNETAIEGSIDRIRSLTREEAFEAAQALAEELSQDSEPAATSERAREFVAEVERAPLEYTADVEEIARGLLVAASLEPDLRGLVDEILDGVGAKAFILGGGEIIALVGLGIQAYKLIDERRRRRASEGTPAMREKTVELSTDEQGKPVVRIRETTVYRIEGDAGDVVAGMLDKP